MPQRVGKHREPGARSKFGFMIDNDVVNRINEVASGSGRTLSAEVEHRLRVALDMEPPENSERVTFETSEDMAAQRLAALADMISKSFVLGVVENRGRRPLALALDDADVISEGLATIIRHVWIGIGEQVAEMRERLIRKLPEF